MTNDNSKLRNGKWKMENGKWKMENGNDSNCPPDQSPFPFTRVYFFGSSVFFGSSALMPSQASITSLLFSFTMYSEMIFCSIFV